MSTFIIASVLFGTWLVTASLIAWLRVRHELEAAHGTMKTLSALSVDADALTEDDMQWLAVFRETVIAAEGRVSPRLESVLSGSQSKCQTCNGKAKARLTAGKLGGDLRLPEGFF